MRNKAGILFMMLGTALIIGALSLLLYNRREAVAAEQASVELLPQLRMQIGENAETEPATQSYEQPLGTPVEFLEPETLEMTEMEIDGYAYIGYLTIPKLELELPVMADWDYPRLKLAPCRYQGTIRGEDLVIMAHNFENHFGRISKLSQGDSVIFTDMDGAVTCYTVAARDVLEATAVEEMTSGAYPLMLFTCTYGGEKRVTICCDRADIG